MDRDEFKETFKQLLDSGEIVIELDQYGPDNKHLDLKVYVDDELVIGY